jgi:protein-S-isoprenylcysteine O-methyltransferase Ste14
MKQSKTRSLLRSLILVLIIVILAPLIPILVTRDFGWWEAWVYAGLSILSFVVSRALAFRRNPDLIKERSRFTSHEDTLAWDKYLAPLVGIGGGLIPIVVALDAQLGWSASSALVVKIIALGAYVAGMIVGVLALITNRFFSGVVRIQTDRDHTVVSDGPYRSVRHPGYAGYLLAIVATPVMLDAYFAYIPVIILTVILCIRTRLEDRVLLANLPGYREYATRVRFRLVPGIW